MPLPAGEWRLDVAVMALYQMALFFSAQLVFVIFLEYMPKTYCNKDDYCYKLESKCLEHYNRSLPNLCSPSTLKKEFEQCVEDKKYLYFESAQMEYQQDCTELTHYSASTNMYLGVLLANLVLGVLADKLGRRPIYFASIFIGTVSLVLSAAIPSLYAFYIFRFTTGVGVAGAQIVGWSYGSEMISSKRRFQLRTFSNWANARILVVLVAFLSRSWKWATYICALGSALIFPILYWLPESPVFLEQKHKIEKSIESRRRIAEICGIEYQETEEKEKINNLKKITFREMLQNARLRRNFLVLCFMWFYVGMATYITDLNGADMSSNLYVGQFLSGLLLTVSKIIFGLAEPRFEWLGRRTVFLFSQGVALFAYVLILVALYTESKESLWYLIVYLCAYSFQALSTETCYLSVAELIPTDVRVTVAAITNICLRIGTIVASLTKPLKFTAEPMLFWINLVVCSVGITVVYFYLEESRNANLQQVGQESESERESLMSSEQETETNGAPGALEESEISTKSFSENKEA